jgi:predicted alpha-1,6-mannanase (GH76 family)
MWHQKPGTSRVALSISLIAIAAIALGSAGCGTRTASSRSSGTPSTMGATLIVPAPSAPSRTHAHTRAATRAQAALDAFDRAFYVASGRQAHYANSTAGARAVFWRQAELIEMQEDAYQNTGDPAAKRKIVALLRGVLSLEGRSWAKHTWNDDIMWMVIASIRAFELTGDTAYRTMAQRNFDAAYARSWSRDFGGGLWWTTDRTQKNVTTNAPAAIAACKLAAALHDPSYVTKAQRLFSWLRKTLYDAKSGAVWDSISRSKGGSGVVINRAGLTYNQGTFIGAAALLHQATRKTAYFEDALRTLGYTKAHLTTNGILPSEAGSNDNFGGFKGIFCRWAVKFVRDNRISTYDAWFQQNADAAWRHRNPIGLMGQDWSVQTGGGVLQAWDCSSAVVLLEAISGP